MSRKGSKLQSSSRRTSFFTQLVSASEDEPKAGPIGKSGTDTQHIYVKSLNEEIRTLTETTVLKEKIKAIKKIGHMMYSGGGILESVRHYFPAPIFRRSP
jgi:hypothetical protein